MTFSVEGGDAAAAGGEENKEQEKKEDESKYTVIGSNAPKQKKGLSMYSKCPFSSLTNLRKWLAPPAPKTEEKYTKEDKTDHELVRGWRVVIQDINIINQTTNIINPFVKFIIGGDYHVSRPFTFLISSGMLYADRWTSRR